MRGPAPRRERERARPVVHWGVALPLLLALAVLALLSLHLLPRLLSPGGATHSAAAHFPRHPIRQVKAVDEDDTDPASKRGKRRRDDDDQAEWEAAIRAAENGGEAPPQNTEDAAQGELGGESHTAHAPETSFESKVEALFQAWSEMYKLDTRAPPAQVLSPNASSLPLPLAPHLEECAELTRRREAAEEFVESGGPEDAQGADLGAKEESIEREALLPEASRRLMQERDGSEGGSKRIPEGGSESGFERRSEGRSEGGAEGGSEGEERREDTEQGVRIHSGEGPSLGGRGRGRGHEGERHESTEEQPGVHRQERETEDGEDRGQQPGLRYPDWACARPGGSREGLEGSEEQQQTGTRGLELCDDPRPPWVRGADEDSLALTRVAQRDLWVHQFPLNCSAPGLRFLLVEWNAWHFHGIGSQIHVMSIAFSLAYATRRILVPVPRTFHRANHEGCREWGRGGTLECYFLPTTSKECLRHARALYKTHKHKELEVTLEELNGSSPVLRIGRWGRLNSEDLRLEATAALAWGRPWAEMTPPYELRGFMNYTFEDRVAQAIWWRSQSVRFLLRHPTSYLCHLTNRARHQAYGRDVAEHIVTAQEAREAILEAKDKFLEPDEPERLKEECPAGGVPLELTDSWRFGGEAYVPRPIVSVHVRQGDKAKEMELYSFPSYMWLAERVRLLVPNLKFVWLSTEMQSVIDQTELFPDWTFLYTRLKRQSAQDESSFEYMKEAGLEVEIGSSFANLMIASEADYFVGVLGSNWNRLLNELRLTNGRLRTKYFALNFDEW